MSGHCKSSGKFSKCNFLLMILFLRLTWCINKLAQKELTTNSSWSYTVGTCSSSVQKDTEMTERQAADSLGSWTFDRNDCTFHHEVQTMTRKSSSETGVGEGCRGKSAASLLKIGQHSSLKSARPACILCRQSGSPDSKGVDVRLLSELPSH